jgi:2-keto-4-pentenoate hydratase/2-oxohepta-3-ene-1,7-dioic acid hydratase in catechol pathway
VRVASYRTDNGTSWGIVRGEQVSDARAVGGAPRSVRELIESADRGRWLQAAARVVRTLPLAAVQLLAPLEPRQDLIALGLNYRTHVDETSGATQQAALPKQPSCSARRRAASPAPACRSSSTRW